MRQHLTYYPRCNPRRGGRLTLLGLGRRHAKSRKVGPPHSHKASHTQKHDECSGYDDPVPRAGAGTGRGFALAMYLAGSVQRCEPRPEIETPSSES
jgi:hypothetical protein